MAKEQRKLPALAISQLLSAAGRGAESTLAKVTRGLVGAMVECIRPLRGACMMQGARVTRSFGFAPWISETALFDRREYVCPGHDAREWAGIRHAPDVGSRSLNAVGHRWPLVSLAPAQWCAHASSAQTRK